MSEVSDNKTPIPFSFGVELEFDFATNNDDAPTYFDALERKDPRGIEYTTDKNNLGDPEKMEILKRVARVLKDNGLLVHVLPQAKVGADYSVWQITLDLTARLVHPDTVNTYLPAEFKVAEEGLGSWTHEGVELVSRILDAPDVPLGVSQPESLLEVEKYLHALRNDPAMPFRIWSNTPYTGLHVHIGRPPKDGKNIQIPLKILQHLSFLLIQYEDVISSLHPFTRRGGCNTAASYADQVSRMIDTNLCSFIELGHTCGERTLISSLTEIRNTLFANNMTDKKLSRLMSKDCMTNKTDVRTKFVNFQRIDRRSTATVEFRQHQGTLSPDAVSQWVLFLIALMRLAEKWSQTQEGPAQRTPMTAYPTAVNSPPRGKAVELLDHLSLDAESRSYWLARFDKYKAVPLEVAAILTEKPCPVCKKRNKKRGISDVEGPDRVKGKKKERA